MLSGGIIKIYALKLFDLVRLQLKENLKMAYSQFKHTSVGTLFNCNGTTYTKINGRIGQITMPDKPYHGKKFYFGCSELCRVFSREQIETLREMLEDY